MHTRELGLGASEGLYTIEGEFVTEHLVVRGELNGPDVRLSDHLNSSSVSITVRPTSVTRAGNGGTGESLGSHASLNKAHLLFVVPVQEPARPGPQANAAWKATQSRRAWVGVGRYSLSGKVHSEAWREPHLVLRDLEQKQFIPLTEVTVTYPDGSSRAFSTVIVNRAHVELFMLRESN